MVMLRLFPDAISDDCGSDSIDTHIELEALDCWRQAICVDRGVDTTVVRLYMQPKDRPAIECMPCIGIDCNPREPGPVPCWEEAHLVQCPGRITGGDGYISITDLPYIPALSNLEVIIYVDNHELCPENDPDLEIECRPFVMRRLIQPPWSRDEIIIPIPSKDGVLRSLCRAKFGFPAPDVRRVRAGRIVVHGHYTEHGEDRYVILAAARFETRQEISWHGDPLGEYSGSSSGCQFIITDIMDCNDLADVGGGGGGGGGGGDGGPTTLCPQECDKRLLPISWPLCSDFRIGFSFRPDEVAPYGICMDCINQAYSRNALKVCKPQPILINGLPYYDCFDFVANASFLFSGTLHTDRLVEPVWEDIVPPAGDECIGLCANCDDAAILWHNGERSIKIDYYTPGILANCNGILYCGCSGWPLVSLPLTTVYPRPLETGWFIVSWHVVGDRSSRMYPCPPLLFFVKQGVLAGVGLVHDWWYNNMINFLPWLNGYLGELLVMCE